MKVPFLQVPFNVKGRFRFLPPTELKVVGSYLLGTCIRPEINVDMAVTMPRVSLSMPAVEWPCPLLSPTSLALSTAPGCAVW